jgi:hypothetical protein
MAWPNTGTGRPPRWWVQGPATGGRAQLPAAVTAQAPICDSRICGAHMPIPIDNGAGQYGLAQPGALWAGRPGLASRRSEPGAGTGGRAGPSAPAGGQAAEPTQAAPGPGGLP